MHMPSVVLYGERSTINFKVGSWQPSCIGEIPYGCALSRNSGEPFQSILIARGNPSPAIEIGPNVTTYLSKAKSNVDLRPLLSRDLAIEKCEVIYSNYKAFALPPMMPSRTEA